jgi:hypothetical protein
MNTKLASIISSICFVLLLGCNKQSGTSDGTSNEQKGPLSGAPFNGETFRSFDGSTVLTLISKDECEMKEGPDTFLCKYTRQDGSLRVVMAQLGTNLVLYFRRVPEGLQDNHGKFLLTPPSYQAAVKMVQEKRLAEQRSQEEAERKRAEQERKKEEERRRLEKIIERSKIESKNVYSGKVLWHGVTIGLQMSDAYFKMISYKGDPFEPIWFGAMRKSEFQIQGNKVILHFFWANRTGTWDDRIEFPSVAEWDKFKAASSSMDKQWHKAFPELTDQVLESYLGN